MGAPLHLARVGTYTDSNKALVEITPEVLADLVDSYDPALWRAPLVIGHPKTNSPAFGYLDRPALIAAGTELEAVPVQVHPALSAAVREGHYTGGSISFWWPQTPGNPKPGRHYLRHFGLLGATPPAIPGLRGADLSAPAPEPDADGPAVLALGVTDLSAVLITTEPTPMPDPAAPTVADLSQQLADLAAKEAELLTRLSALDAKAADLTAREQQLRDQEAAASLASATAFAEGLADQAKIRPADVARVAAALVDMDSLKPAAEFAAPDDAQAPLNAGAWFRAFLGDLPPLVELSQVATKAAAGQGAAAKSDTDVAAEARAYRARMAERGTPVTLAQAVDAVEAGTAA
jgi:hypothetical protein